MTINDLNINEFLMHLQKPIMLQGHERSITQIKYNLEGDLIFTASKDKIPNVWFSVNGERLGTFHGHAGTSMLLYMILIYKTKFVMHKTFL